MTEALRTANALKGIDRAKLDLIVDPIARAHGAEVVDMEFKPDQGGWVLRIYVEKLGSAEQKLSTEASAVSLDICSDISKELSPALDVADLVPHAYNLEVGSPGVERSLRGIADYVRFTGKKAKIKLHEGVASPDGTAAQKVVIGILGGVGRLEEASAAGDDSRAEPSHLLLTDGGKTYSIPLSDVSSARLVFEFGPAPKPGKSGKGPSKSKAPAERSKRSV